MRELEKEVIMLLHKVGRPSEDRVFSTATEKQIEDFEKETMLCMPERLKQWLFVANGPCVGQGGIMGVYPPRQNLDMLRYYQLYPDWLDLGWIPVAGDGCGNYYVVPTRHEYGVGEPVLFIEACVDEKQPLYIVASDIWYFLRFVFKEEFGENRWPFDEEYVTSEDPRVQIFHNIALPWDV